jgi:hypothetical protein
MEQFDLWLMIVLAPVAFVQNAVFTLVSRSRAAANLPRHFKAALASNGVWLVTSLFVWRGFWPLFYDAQWWPFVVMGCIYTLSTAAGSTCMMAANLGRFKGRPWGLAYIHRLLVETDSSQVGKR